MHAFSYDYIKPKSQDNTKLSYIDTDSFVVYIQTENIYIDITDDVKKTDTPNYEIVKPLPIGKNKK